MLIAIAIAVCLAVAGVVHGLVSPDAVAVVPDSALAPVVTGPASKSPVGADTSIQNHSPLPRP